MYMCKEHTQFFSSIFYVCTHIRLYMTNFNNNIWFWSLCNILLSLSSIALWLRLSIYRARDTTFASLASAHGSMKYSLLVLRARTDIVCLCVCVCKSVYKTAHINTHTHTLVVISIPESILSLAKVLVRFDARAGSIIQHTRETTFSAPWENDAIFGVCVCAVLWRCVAKHTYAPCVHTASPGPIAHIMPFSAL